MQWATRKGIRLDRSACIWLIKRKIDSQAAISFLDEADIPKAVEVGASVFHNTVSEEPSTRERTSFQELLHKHGLDTDPALALMGQIVYGAETKDPGSIEESEGLRAIAKGVNGMVKNDQEMADGMMPIFDAVHSYCARRVSGHRAWANEEPGWGS